MFKPFCAAILLTVIVAHSAAAGEVVEVRVLETRQAAGPTTQIATPPMKVPKDATVLLSIESLADGGGDFDSKCVVEGRTIRLKGHVTTSHDGERRMNIDFSDRDKTGGRQIATNVLMGVNDQKVIGGLIGGKGVVQLIVATIKPNPRTAAAKAE